MLGLQDKAAIVTGGGGAIGRAIARRLGDEGVVVGVLDRNAESGDETAQLLCRAGARAAARKVDIADYAAVVEAVDSIERQHGPTDILVNKCRLGPGGSFFGILAFGLEFLDRY